MSGHGEIQWLKAEADLYIDRGDET